MPRATSNVPRLVAQQQRQAKYRERLRAAGRPEVSAVDIAVAMAVGEATRQLAEDLESGTVKDADQRKVFLGKIALSAAKLLIDSGCSKEHARTQIAHRFRVPRKPSAPPITS